MADCIPLHEIISVRSMVQDEKNDSVSNGASLFMMASSMISNQMKMEAPALSQSDEERFSNAIRIETIPHGYNSGVWFSRDDWSEIRNLFWTFIMSE